MAANGQPNAAGGGKRESIINYEVDKTIRVVKGATGIIKRINAAAVVDDSLNQQQGQDYQYAADGRTD